MVETGRYGCDSQGSRAAEMEAEPGGGVPSERAEIQVRSDRGTGAGELVKFGQPVWYRFSFKIPGDWPQDVSAAGRQLCRTVIHQIKQDSEMPEIVADTFQLKETTVKFQPRAAIK